MSTSNTLRVECIYCGYTWSVSTGELEKRNRVIYREDPGSDPPTRTVEYLVTCPNCSRRLMAKVQVRGE